MRQIVLATQSRYKRELFSRLGLPHLCASAEVDERRLGGEAPVDMAARLAEAKARAVAEAFPDALIVGCDQVAWSAGAVLGKPGGMEAALEQLSLASGGEMLFWTSVAVLDSANGRLECATEPTRVLFRELDAQRLRRYLQAEQPWDCAGSFKSEGMGIKLFRGIESRDPTALVGLPLIALCDLLERFGTELFPDLSA